MANLSQCCKMPFGQFLRLDRGSNTIAFALIAPLLVGSFLAVSEIANLANVQITLSTAAKSAAREASRFDGSFNDGFAEADRVLQNQGITHIDFVQIQSVQLSDQRVIEVVLKKNYRISWLNYSLLLTAIGQSVDEKNF